MSTKVRCNKLPIVILFIISLTVACTADYGDTHLTYIIRYIQYAVGIFWIFFTGINMVYRGSSARSIVQKDTIWFLKMYLIPQLVFYLYSIIIILLGYSKWEYLGTNLSSFIPLTLAIIAYYFFDKNAIKYICISIALSWTISIISALLKNGFGIIKSAIIQGYFDLYYNSGYAKLNYFEIHDIVLAVGYFIVFYFYSNIKIQIFSGKEKYKRYLLIFLIIAFLGIKRISILGVIIALLFYIPIKKMRKKLTICIVSGWIAFVICVLFIYILSSGNWVWEWLQSHGINPAGRNRYFQAALSLSTFSPTYLGLGRGAIAEIFKSEMSYLGVGGVHSDLIKIFVENGLILYCWWLWYFLIHNTKKYAKRFSVNSAVVYFGITIYMFVLYSTDNTDTYFACQLLCVILPITFATKQRNIINELGLVNPR